LEAERWSGREGEVGTEWGVGREKRDQARKGGRFMSSTYHSPLHKASCHDNDGNVLFPDHSPEIRHSLWNRTWRRGQRSGKQGHGRIGTRYHVTAA